MSSFIMTGFFGLGDGKRSVDARPAYYCFYPMTIQCKSDQSFIPAEIRVYTPPHDTVLPCGTVVFLTARTYLPADLSGKHTALLDAIAMYPIPGDPA
ncbi:hypothetical protein K474DRAFT_1577413, partial [Panus rudis PR-1116 ss-1]